MSEGQEFEFYWMLGVSYWVGVEKALLGVAALVDAARDAVKSIEWHSERGCGLAIDEDSFLALCAALKGEQRKPTGKVAALRKALSQCLERAERASSSEAEMALEGIASVARAALGAL